LPLKVASVDCLMTRGSPRALMADRGRSVALFSFVTGHSIGAVLRRHPPNCWSRRDIGVDTTELDG